MCDLKIRTLDDADENGYVTYPNVNTVTEMTNLIDATRAYEANTTAFDATKSMVQAALNVLGSVHVAAFTAANKIEQVVTQAYVAMGTTMATYGAQNMGAGNVPRIRQGFKACTILGVIYSFIAAAFVMTVGKYMTYLFVSENVGVIMDSVEIYLWCIGICFIPLAVVNIYRNGIQGLGYGLLPMMAGVAEPVSYTHLTLPTIA